MQKSFYPFTPTPLPCHSQTCPTCLHQGDKCGWMNSAASDWTTGSGGWLGGGLLRWKKKLNSHIPFGRSVQFLGGRVEEGDHGGRHGGGHRVSLGGHGLHSRPLPPGAEPELWPGRAGEAEGAGHSPEAGEPARGAGGRGRLPAVRRAKSAGPAGFPPGTAGRGGGSVQVNHVRLDQCFSFFQEKWAGTGFR